MVSCTSILFSGAIGLRSSKGVSPSDFAHRCCRLPFASPNPDPLRRRALVILLYWWRLQIAPPPPPAHPQPCPPPRGFDGDDVGTFAPAGDPPLLNPHEGEPLSRTQGALDRRAP